MMMTEDSAYFPLSLPQEGMWLAMQITPASAAYNVPYLLSLSGPVHKEYLALALADCIARHETLRTTFVLQEGELVQVVADHLDLPYWERDFRDAANPLAEAQQFVISEAQHLFDLATGPLMRVWLLQSGDEDYQLLLVMHHMICDGWSIEVFLRELAERYVAYSEGHIHHLPPLPIQYVDFAVWQRQRLQGKIHATLSDYWQRTLASAPALLALATDRPRPAVQSFRGTDYLLDLPYALATSLIVLGQSEQCTLFMTLLAAFQTTLYRFTEQSDLVIGSPMANRSRPEVQGLIGLFTNMLPLRSQLAPDLTWRQLLKQVRATTLEAYTHQELPFEELVKVIQPIRIAGASPCFQVTFSLQQSEQESFRLPGLVTKTIDLHNDTSKFDLTLHMQLTPERFTASFIYSTDLFATATIQRIAEYMQIVLEHVLAYPDTQLATLPLPAQGQAGDHYTPLLIEKAKPLQEVESVAPQNPLEQLIVEIWQNVLGISEIGVQDTFFDLGGYSLLMIQVQRQLQDALHLEISLTDLFRFPTVHAVADFLSHGFDGVPALMLRRERGRARDEALNQQRTRRQTQRSRRGGSHD